MVFSPERHSFNAFFNDPVKSINETITLTESPQKHGLESDDYYYKNNEDNQSTDPQYHNHSTPTFAIVPDILWMYTLLI